MWEKLSDYFLDISKYLITATFITTFVGDMGEELHWLIYLVSFILAAGLFGFALYFDKKEDVSMNTLIFLGMFAVFFGVTIAILLSPWGQKWMNEY